MKKTLLLSSILLGLGFNTSTFAVEKNIDFYSASAVNRYTVLGKISELPEVKLNGKMIFVENLDNNVYLTVNQKTPYYIGYSSNDNNIYSVIQGNKGKILELDRNGKKEKFKLINILDNTLILESVSNPNDDYQLVKVDDKLNIPKDWFIFNSEGIKAIFDNNVKSDDTIFYSQQETALSYNNEYKISLINDSQLSLIHYINVMNQNRKTFENVKLNFFLSEANVNNIRALPLYRKSMMAAAAPMVENMAMDKPEFNPIDIAELKTISLKDPVNIYPNINKIKYIEKTLNYTQFVNVPLNLNKKVFYSAPLEFEENTFNRWLENEKRTFINSLLEEKNFTNIISIKMDKDIVIPQGELQIYDKASNGQKMLVSTPISHNEHKDLDVLKSINRDLKITKVNLYKDQITSSKDPKNLNKVVLLNVKDITFTNDGKIDYHLNLNKKKYLIKSGSSVVVPITIGENSEI